MLNFSSLEKVVAKYNLLTIKNAELCSEQIKLITKKFIELDVPTFCYSFTDESADVDIIWNADTEKIIYSVNGDDTKFLAGATALFRAYILDHLQSFIDEAVFAVHKVRSSDQKESEILGDEDESCWREPEDGASYGDVMCSNGID